LKSSSPKKQKTNSAECGKPSIALRKNSTPEEAKNERIQYGNLKDRIARQKAAVRAAKRNTKGIKALNPFLAQPIKKKD
jgi:hypothetical protein